MAINYHQPSVNALLDAMPLPVLTFGVNGAVTYANKAAKLHPGHPVEAMGGKPVIKSLANDLNLGKVKLPYAATVELAAGIKVKGDFMAGLSGLDIAFVIKSDTNATNEEPKANRSGLSNIIALLRDELGPPMRKLSGALGSLPESTQTTEAEEAKQALDQRLRRLSDLIAVFGDEVLVTEDRVELATLVQSVCEELRPKALAKKVHFEVVSPTQTLPPLYGNARMIHRAFYECFDNAVTHSRKEVNSNQSLSVKIAYTLTGEHVLITVRNQGAIPEEEKGVETREVFAKPVAGAPNDGKGRLGLPLVQRIVGLFGGNMRMSSVGDDEVKVMMEFPTGAPQRGQSQLDIAQAQRYASDLAQLMSRRKKEK
jgi:signal transduction histidine kinase